MNRITIEIGGYELPVITTSLFAGRLVLVPVDKADDVAWVIDMLERLREELPPREEVEGREAEAMEPFNRMMRRCGDRLRDAAGTPRKAGAE